MAYYSTKNLSINGLLDHLHVDHKSPIGDPNDRNRDKQLGRKNLELLHSELHLPPTNRTNNHEHNDD